MKDYTKEEIENGREDISAIDAVEFCLEQLYKDNQKRMFDDVCRHCTYAELIGALLLARDTLHELENEI